MRTLRLTGAVLATLTVLGMGAMPSYAEATNPAPPRPPIQVPPPRETPNCVWVSGFHLQTNGPPIPFFELRCS